MHGRRIGQPNETMQLYGTENYNHRHNYRVRMTIFSQLFDIDGDTLYPNMRHSMIILIQVLKKSISAVFDVGFNRP
jgi:hypothetical protein